MSRGARFAWSLVAVAGLGGLGLWLRWRLRAITGGNLLVFVAVAAVPLLVYTFLRLVGWWPDEPGLDYAGSFRRLNGAWVTMELVSLAVAVLATIRLRFPIMMLLVGIWWWFLALDLVRLALDHEKWAWDSPYLWLSGSTGLLMAGVAGLLFRRGLDEYGMWLALVGNAVWVVQIGALALVDENATARVLLPVLGVAAVVVSAWLQARIYLAFGAIALYGWVSYLVFDIFGAGLGVTFGLVVIGLLILLTGVAYQRVVEPWLGARFKRRVIVKS